MCVLDCCETVRWLFCSFTCVCIRKAKSVKCLFIRVHNLYDRAPLSGCARSRCECFPFCVLRLELACQSQ